MMIHLEGINKTYFNGAPLHVLKGIDLDIEKGEMVSIMGASGSGKSTLLNILGILDTYDTGTYTLNGQLIRNLSETRAAELRNRMIGFIFQSFNLISFKNAMENVALPLYYQGISRKKRNAMALEYLDMVGLKDWAEHMPNEMSGGQKQRLCIARALLANAKILIFDDSTSAVDTATEKKIRKELEKLGDVTKIIIAQRISSVIHTDRILILDDGKIHNIGTHEQLLKEDAIYQEIYASQMKGGNSDGIENEEC
jgi:putative ABC transport system ATP-binding protein